MKKGNQKNNHGSVNCSPRIQISKLHRNDSVSSTSKTTISKYFHKQDMTDCKSQPIEFDSPYKNILSEPKLILNDSSKDESDFKTPKVIKFASKTKVIKKTRAKRRKPNSKGIQKTITRMIEDNFSHTDTNPEHLQMALMLSKSEQPEETSPDDENIYDFPSTQQKILGVRKTLEHFGFKSDKPTWRRAEVTKKTKKSRYQYITPVLYLRTEEDRQKLIANKISLILSQNSNPEYSYEKENPEVKSQYLSNLLCPSCCIYRKANMNCETIHNGFFYVKGLNMEMSRGKCGHLLKDWSQIPGRDKTPTRTIENEIQKDTEIKEIHLDNLNCVNENDGVIVIDDQEGSENSTNFICKSIEIKENIRKKCIKNEIVADIEQNKSPIIGNSIVIHTISSCERENYRITNNDDLKCYLDGEKYNQLEHNVIESNLSENLSNRMQSPDLFDSEDDEIIEINNSINDKLQESIQMLENMKRSFSQKITRDEESNNTYISPISISEDEEDVEESSSTINSNISISKMPTPIKYQKNEDSINNLIDCGNNIEASEYHLKDSSKEEVDYINSSSDTVDSQSAFICRKKSNSSSECNSSPSTGKLSSETVISIYKEYSSKDTEETVQNDMNNTNDIVATLEITLSQNLTPKNKQIEICSASLLSNFKSLNKQKENTHSSTDDSNAGNTYENLNVVEHFESFCDDLNISKDKIYDLTQSDDEHIVTKLDKKYISSDYQSNSVETDSFNISKDNINNMHNLESFDNVNKIECDENIVQTLKQTKSSKGTIEESESTKKIYDISSDNEDTILYEFTNEQHWQKQDESQLRTENILNVNGDFSFNINDSDLEENRQILTKSLSFTLGNNCDLDRTTVFKTYATFSTPSQNTTNPNTSKIEKHSSISSESYSEDGVICVSDEEINYSSIHSTPYNKSKRSTVNEVVKLNSDEMESEANKESYSYLEKYYDDNCIYYTQNDFQDHIATLISSPLSHPRILELSNKKASCSNKKTQELEESEVKTPNTKATNSTTDTPDGFMIIKTTNVTPMPDYDEMDTPKIAKELNKIGVKPLKRHRGVQLLKHVYDMTHPVVEHQEVPDEDSGDNKNVKRPKIMKSKSRRNLELESYSNACAETEEIARKDDQSIEIVGDILENEDLIFERKQSKKNLSCPVPLHIAWHNLVSSNLQLRENILLYEPLQLEILYAMLKEQGYKYHIQDLLTFLDKKCITVRTNQNTSQNRRKRY